MWDKLIKNFKNYLKIERNLSENTITSYLFDLQNQIYIENLHNRLPIRGP